MEYFSKQEFLKQCAKLPSATLQILAHQYLNGIGEEKDEDLAISLFEMAYKNDKLALFTLAQSLCYGDGDFSKNALRGRKILEDLDKNNMPEASFQLGELYSRGDGVKEDRAKAIAYYEKAYKKGYSLAMHELGRAYQHGDGVNQDYAKAKQLYEQAIKKGYILSYINLGSMYESGLGVEKDYKKALELYKKALPTGSKIVYYNIGHMYYEGEGVPKDYATAYKYLKKSADLGDPDAMLNLGLMYLAGDGVKQDYKMAVKLYEKAARGGVSMAKNNLAIMYRAGQGVEKDEYKAFKLIEESANEGCLVAQFNLATAYIAGLGCDKDAEKGEELLAKLVGDESLGVAINYVYGKICQDKNTYGQADQYTYQEIINYFKKSLELCDKLLNGKNQEELMLNGNMTYACFDCLELAETYLEMYYLQEANTDNRNVKHYREDLEYKKEAKKYLDMAYGLKKYLINYTEEEFSQWLDTYRGLLENTSDDISNMTYEEFKEKYYNKQPNIFLLTLQKETNIYEEGLKFYFEKRDRLVAELTARKANEQQEIQNSIPLIRKILKAKGLTDEDIDRQLNEMQQKTTDDESMEDELDYSVSVINLDKYLEEILHTLFVEGIYEYNKEKIDQDIQDKIAKISLDIKSIREEHLKYLNQLLSNINENATIDRSKREDSLKRYIDFFKNPKGRRTVGEGKIPSLKEYLEENDQSLNDIEKQVLQNIIEVYELRQESNELTKDEKFEMGRLYHLGYVDYSSNLSNINYRVLNENFVEFVKSVNPDMNKEKIRLKLNELILKVEMFRVAVRNVASHKARLSKLAVEEGINICMVQENSIFELINELFGEYIKYKYADKYAQSIMENLNVN